MSYIDPHIHMSSRTTNDYEAMHASGITAIIEPAFWLGQARTNAGSYVDYLSSLVGWERFRASQFGIQHFCAIGLNSKEANNEALAEEVMEILPQYLVKDGVVAVGEIGFDDHTKLEEKYLRQQIELAKEIGLKVMVHTPHRDKLKGTLKTLDIVEEHGVSANQVIIDHNNELTVKSVLDRGYWTAFTIYPNTKMDSERMVAVVKKYGSERIIVDSSADWGISDPLSVPKTAQLMIEHGISEYDISQTCYQNAYDAYELEKYMIIDNDEVSTLIDQTHTYKDSSILRGQKPKVQSKKKNSCTT